MLCLVTSATMAWAEEEVSTAEQLKAALTSPTVSQVRLTSDISLTETIELTQIGDITLDLAGFNITATDCRALWIKSGSLTITTTDPETPGKISVIGTTIASNQSVIRVGDKDTNVNGASLVINEGVTIETDRCYGITIFGKSRSQSLTVGGTIKTNVCSAISGNGSSGLNPTTITVNETAELFTTNDIVIYHPQSGELTVNGSLTGAGGIEIKAGKLTVGSTAEIEATATPTHTANNDGTSTMGYAIAIVENGKYAGVSSINISKDAKITGPIAVLKDSENPTTQGVTFEGDVKMVVKVTDSDSKVFGQYLTLEDAFREAPDNCTFALMGDCVLTSTLETTKNYTLDLDGHTLTGNGKRALHIKTGVVTIKSTTTGGTISVPTLDNPDSSVIRVGSNDTAEVSLTVETGVTINTDEGYGISIFGKNSSETLSVAGKVTTKTRPAISGNGTKGLASTNITIATSAEIITTDEVAVYHPQAGTLNVDGKVTGSTAIEIKGGTLLVSSSAVVTATGTPDHNPNGDGTSSRGYAIAIVENAGGYGNGEGVKAVTIDNSATIVGPIAQLQDSSIAGFNPTYTGDAISKKVAAIGEDKFFTVKDAVDIVPAQGTVKLLESLTLNETLVMSKVKAYTLDLAGFDLTGNGRSAVQIAGGQVTIVNTGSDAKKITVSSGTTAPVILMGSDEGDNRNVSLTIDDKVIVDGGTATSGILLSGNKTRESLTVRGEVTASGHSAIMGSKDADRGGTTIHIVKEGIVQATDAIVIYHPQSGDLIVDGKVTGSGTSAGAIEMKGGDLTVSSDAVISAVGTPTHTANNDAPSTNGYAIALVENAQYSGVGKANISKDANISGVIAYLVDSKNASVNEPKFTGDIYMVAQTNNAGGMSEKYAKLTDAINATLAGGKVKLLDDILMTETLTIGKAMTLDMDDYSIIGNQTTGTTITIGANVTLLNGGITSDKGGICITNGTVSLTQMTVKTKGESLKVTGGTTTADEKSSFTSTEDHTVVMSGGSLTMGGKVYNTSSLTNNNAVEGTGSAALEVESSSVISSAKGKGIDWQATGTLTIKGGKIMGAEAVYANAGTVTIQEGNFTGTGNALEIADTCTPLVKGGTFICGAAEGYLPISATSATRFVQGNYFSKPIAQTLCASGYMISQSPKNNGMYYLVDEIVINDGTSWTIPSESFTIHKAKYVRNSGMGANGTKFGTLCLPFSFSPTAQTGMAFYAVNKIEGDVLYLTPVNDVISAGTPVIFQFGEATSNFTIESTDAEISNGDAQNENNLVGTFSKKVIEGEQLTSIYYLNGDAFHQAKTKLTVPAYRAYIQLTSTNARADVLNIFIEDETDDLQSVMTEQEEEQVFDLQGNRQDGLKPGFNIVRTMDGRTIKVYVNK